MEVLLMKKGEATDEEARQLNELLERIRPHITGLGPLVMANVVASLTASWICGFQPRAIREQILEDWVAVVRDTIDQHVDDPRPSVQ